MNRLALFISFLIVYVLISCQNHFNSVNIKSNETDSIKNLLNIDDSILVIYNGSDNRATNIVFLDYNLHSIYHEQLIERKNERIPVDSIRINEFYKNLNSTRQLFKVTFPTELKGYWYEVHRKDNKFYLHRPCCFTSLDMINDTVYMDDNMMGGVPLFLLDINENHGKYSVSAKKSEYDGTFFTYNFSLELIDKNKMIYKFSDGNKCEYLIHESKINTLPIIIEHCDMIIFPHIVSFDSIKCE